MHSVYSVLSTSIERPLAALMAFNAQSHFQLQPCKMHSAGDNIHQFTSTTRLLHNLFIYLSFDPFEIICGPFSVEKKIINHHLIETN